jgi:hypothetical protein
MGKEKSKAIKEVGSREEVARLWIRHSGEAEPLSGSEFWRECARRTEVVVREWIKGIELR